MSTSPSGTLAPARRRLPANLSHSQRRTLEQFLGGQISAGALSAKLAQAEPGTLAAEPDRSRASGAHRAHSVQPAPTPPRQVAGRPAATAEMPRITAARRRRVVLPVVLLAAVFLATLCAFTVASASTSSEPLGGPAIAKRTRAGHHRRPTRTSQVALIPASSTSGPSGTLGARRAHRQATPPGLARGRGHAGKAGPAGKPGDKPVAKPAAGPAPQSGSTPSGTGGGAGSTPTGDTAAGAGPSSGQSTPPASSGTSGSGSGTSTSGSSSDTTTSGAPSPTASESSAS